MAKLAFVFAGQGAQSVGMGRALYDNSEGVRALFDMAEKQRPGITVICFNGPEDLLAQTVNTQPCLFLTGLACATALNERDINADGVAGFSLGEVPAICHAGLLSPVQAFDFVCRRAQVMHDCAAANPGEMYAVLKLPSSVVEELCADIEQAWPVNYNCPGQTVAACAASSSRALLEAVRARGGKAVKLSVGGAFHSPFMDYAANELKRYLGGTHFGEPSIPVYSNRTGQVYGDPKILASEQVNHPVLWQKTIENMIADGYSTFIESGPGSTLSGLIRKINPGVRVYQVSDLISLDKNLFP